MEKIEKNNRSYYKKTSKEVTFTENNMVDLLTAYTAYLKLEDALCAITEIDPSRGLLRDMRKLDDLLQDLSPVFDSALDYDEQEYAKIITSDYMNIREKARLLLRKKG